MSSKIEQLSLSFCVMVENYSETTTAEGNHTGCFVVSLFDIVAKIGLIIDGACLLFTQ